MTSITANASLLRKGMLFNGLFSGLSGLACLFFAQTIAVFLGLGAENYAEISQQGISLVGFAVFLLIASSRLVRKSRTLRNAGWTAVVLDVLWVVGSFVILLGQLVPFSEPGNWLIAILAFLVADFALVQYLGLRRLRP